MKCSLWKRAAAVVVAVCVGVTFIPLAGEYAVFAADGDDQVTNEQLAAEGETPKDVTGDSSAEETDPAGEPEGTAGEQENGTDGDSTDPTEGDEVKNGLVEEDGATYYYVDGEKQELTGIQMIDGKKYYFDPETFALKTGLLTVDNAKYYFNPEAKTGIVKIGSLVFKFNSDGTAYMGKGWIENKARYANGNGTVANGVKYIDKKYYLFNANNGLRITTAGFTTQAGRTYYIASGVVSRGWKAIGKRAYYFGKSGNSVGVQAKNTTIGYLKIPACGYLGEAYALGIKKLDKTKWTLKQAYKNSYKIKYQGRWWRQKTSEAYALKGFKKNKGNCYVMAATFYIQAKLLGYNVRQIHGKVAHRYPHSWTQIKKKGSKWRVYDPNFKNETGRNGWNIYYGKKGTWRYTNYSVFQK